MLQKNHTLWTFFFSILGLASLIGLGLVFRIFFRKSKRKIDHADKLAYEKTPELKHEEEIIISQTSLTISEARSKAQSTADEEFKSNFAQPLETQRLCNELPEIAGSCLDSQLRIFLENIAARIREESSNLGDNMTIDFIEELVDRIDELACIAAKTEAHAASRITQFSHHLTEILENAGVELLRSDVWKPEIQRALTKSPKEGIIEPIIENYGSTGFMKNSQLIRKQEVFLSIPKTK